MARIKKGSRRAVLIAAFVLVMSMAGGLLGAVTGAVIVLLLRSMFNMSAGITEFVTITVLLGALLASILGLMLTVEWPQREASRAGTNVAGVAPVSVVPAGQSVDGQ